MSVTPQTITNWETGATDPSPEAVDLLGRELDFPPAFFGRADLEAIPRGGATFRARTKMSSRDRDTALAAGALATELASWIEARFELPAFSIPDLSTQDDPELAAKVVRNEWLLGEKPIPNVVQLLESRGVLVFSLAQDCHELDAFSFWSGSRPIVLLNTMKSAEHSRMDAAHELAHLVLHREETGKAEEHEAGIFAGALLMPAGDVYRQIPRIINLDQLIEAKRRWGVSLAALVYRLHRLRIANDWQYRSLFVELSKRGYRTNEPKPIARETSTLLMKVFASLRDQGVSPRRLAAELSWHPAQLNEFIFGLGATLLPVEGGRGVRSKG